MRKHLFNTVFIAALWLIFGMHSHGALLVQADKPLQVASKTIVKVSMKNTFKQGIKSARAAVFLTDQKGKIVGQISGWVINGKKGLPSSETNTFNFVIPTARSFETKNLSVHLEFNKIIFEDGTFANVPIDVVISESQAK